MAHGSRVRVPRGVQLAVLRRLRRMGLQYIITACSRITSYQLEGFGVVYIVGRVLTTVYNAYMAGKISQTTWGIPRILRLDDAHIASAIPNGPTSGMRTTRVRIACYSVLRAAERVVHLSLKHAGAGTIRRGCSCSKSHREFYNFNAAGGYQGVERLIERWLRIMGQSWIRTAL
ncbi:hypothetical protein B0H13DRAFT_1902264 [Mycena leptocephala]|nr:hypothetical protein B0H13DRAFT_1902264 [Mycena leptocephala]